MITHCKKCTMQFTVTGFVLDEPDNRGNEPRPRDLRQLYGSHRGEISRCPEQGCGLRHWHGSREIDGKDVARCAVHVNDSKHPNLIVGEYLPREAPKAKKPRRKKQDPRAIKSEYWESQFKGIFS